MPDDFIDVTFKTCVVYHVFIAGAFGPPTLSPDTEAQSSTGILRSVAV